MQKKVLSIKSNTYTIAYCGTRENKCFSCNPQDFFPTGGGQQMDLFAP